MRAEATVDPSKVQQNFFALQPHRREAGSGGAASRAEECPDPGHEQAQRNSTARRGGGGITAALGKSWGSSQGTPPLQQGPREARPIACPTQDSMCWPEDCPEPVCLEERSDGGGTALHYAALEGAPARLSMLNYANICCRACSALSLNSSLNWAWTSDMCTW